MESKNGMQLCQCCGKAFNPIYYSEKMAQNEEPIMKKGNHLKYCSSECAEHIENGTGDLPFEKGFPYYSDKAKHLALTLTQEEIIDFLNIISQSLDVFVGGMNNYQICGEVKSVCLNGLEIQINMEYTDLKNLTDDPFINEAFSKNKLDHTT